MLAGALFLGMLVGIAIGLGCARLVGPAAIAVAVEAGPVAKPTALQRFVSHPPLRGASELAEEVAGIIANDGLAVLTARYIVEAYGRGIADLHIAVVEHSGLPRDVADEACAIAIRSMGGP